ncbi:MAG: DUF177 domain-containing protein [Actinomycetota bacterium]
MTSSLPSRLLVDVAELRRRPGTRRALQAEIEIPNLEAGERSIVDGRLVLDVVVESVMEGVVAAGTVAGVWRAPCRRCVDDMDEAFVADFREVFERSPTEGETLPLENEQIDLTPVAREHSLLSIPLAPLCRDDCEGPDPRRFPTGPFIDLEPDLEEKPAGDPRWAALDALTFDD